MKKIQNYLTKPDELRKKLQNPSFRHDFMQWSKVHLCQGPNRQQSKSRSPHQRSRSQLGHSKNHYSHNTSQLNTSHQNPRSKSKQNISPNQNITNSHNFLSNKSYNSIPKKNINNNDSKLNLKVQKTAKDSSRSIIKPKKPLPSQSKSHSILQPYGYRAFEQENKYSRVNYSSLRKNQQRPQSQPNYSTGINYKSKKNLGHNKSIDSALQLKKVPKQKKKMQFKCSYRTRQGVLVSNPNKTNQDRLLIKNSVNGTNKNIFAVADGHGTYGHIVSQCIVSNLGAMVDEDMNNNQDKSSNKGKTNYQSSSGQPQHIFPSIYNKIQKILTQGSEFNASCSGSTLVTVCLDKQYITCANVGDSRAILARQVDKKSWEVIYLSQDQKPSIQSEKKRILKHGGRVHSLRDQKGEQVGPLRVWLPHQNIQGLAMSRSLGDNVSKPYGVTHKPEIIKIPTDIRDKFILVASDGVWQFITNQQVLQLIVPFYREKKLQQACDALLKLAYDRWTVEDTTVIDDITLILIFLQN